MAVHVAVSPSAGCCATCCLCKRGGRGHGIRFSYILGVLRSFYLCLAGEVDAKLQESAKFFLYGFVYLVW